MEPAADTQPDCAENDALATRVYSRERRRSSALHVERATRADSGGVETGVFDRREERDPPPSLVVAEQALIGGRYRPLSDRQPGGRGGIRLVEDTETGARCALELLEAAPAVDHERLTRLRHAIEAASCVQHPGLVVPLGHGVSEGIPFVVTEWRDGMTLGERLRGGPPLSWQALVDVLQQVARALSVAHAASLVHGDLGADDILLPSDGTGPRVCDLGVAGWLASPDAPSDAPADDVHALGGVLYEALTGRRVVRVGAASLVQPAPSSSVPPGSPRASGESAPAHLASLAQRCISAKPEARPSMAELAETLSGGPAARILPSGMAPFGAAAGAETLRNPRPRAARIVLVAALAGGLAALACWWVRHAPASPQPPPAAIVEEAPLD